MAQVHIELRELSMPLVRPFRTSKGEDSTREALLLRWVGEDGAEGWAECAADPAPVYFPEYIAAVRETVVGVLLPCLAEVAGQAPLTAAEVRAASAAVVGNPIAKGLLETAVLDAQLRRHGMPLADYLGAVRRPIPVGVSVGIPGDIDTLLGWVQGYLDDGYGRVKLKIEPGWDVEPVRAVREAFGAALPLQVDANQAYRSADIPLLSRLDAFGLLLLEQPFPADQLVPHAALAKRTATPICLDESILGLGDAAAAIRLGAADVVNIKPSRVGGYLTSREIHDLCLAEGVPVFCGGTLETGVGRAANLALAALPGFTLPGDISATSRYYAEDITQPFELVDGTLIAPPGPGTGAALDFAVVERLTTRLDTHILARG